MKKLPATKILKMWVRRRQYGDDENYADDKDTGDDEINGVDEGAVAMRTQR